jgi:hypothetical protein
VLDGAHLWVAGGSVAMALVFMASACRAKADLATLAKAYAYFITLGTAMMELFAWLDRIHGRVLVAAYWIAGAAWIVQVAVAWAVIELRKRRT